MRGVALIALGISVTLTFSRGATRCEAALPAYGATRRPFHQNEAGSQEWNTLTLMGQHTVPLIEDHAATRERWSLNSLTDSVEEQISDDNMPGFEIMFKAEGKQVEASLQAYVSQKQILGMRVTVVTGPSGSYREDDILTFLEKHLPPGGLPADGKCSCSMRG